MAGANDDSERRGYEKMYRYYARDNSLIVPDTEDWLMTSKVLYWLAQGRKRSAKGKAPEYARSEKQIIFLGH